MQMFSLAAAGLVVLGAVAVAPRFAFADDKDRISGPHVHENLAVYFIHGTSAPGPVPLTLQEALDKGSVRVIETGEVNELKIENTGSDEIFIQSGDIVKGGRQDRVLSMSFVLPPKSGEVSLAAFCVEHGRWSGRGAESAVAFASANETLPSREAKLAMRAPMKVEVGGAERAPLDAGDRVYTRQEKVWASVASVQNRLSEQLSAEVASPRSATSLQLSLENDKLKEAREAYIKALQSFGDEKDDIIGYVFAVNGKVNSADVYPSNALFRKMWPKLLAASVTEAIGADKDAAAAAAPAPASVGAFLTSAESGSAQEETVNGVAREEVRDAKGAVFMEAKRSDGAWVHRNYLAK